MIEELRVEVVELKAEVADLKRRLAQNSRNSSRPPSSDGLSKPAPKSLRRPSGRTPGGQRGHPGGHLARVAVPDEIVDHVPSVCAGCQGDHRDGHDVGHLALQVFDLPEIRLRVSEHRAQRRRCACGHETTAAFPDAVTARVQYVAIEREVAAKRAAHRSTASVQTPITTAAPEVAASPA